MRNLRSNLPREHAEKVIKSVKAARFRPGDRERVVKDFQELLSSLDLFGPADPSYVQRLINKVHKFFAFLDYPHEIHKYIYTTDLLRLSSRTSGYKRRSTGASSLPKLMLSVPLLSSLITFPSVIASLSRFQARLYYLHQIAALNYHTHF